MSASNKKKLRKEQELEQLTTRQRQEKDEAKTLKIYTTAFVSLMVLIICLFGGILLFQQNHLVGVLPQLQFSGTRRFSR